LMTENCPDSLKLSADDALAITGRWAAKLKSAYAVSPRFAPSCSMGVMKQAAKITDQHGCFIQTNLAESLDEVAWVHKLFPDCHSYADVYKRAGLLGPRTILGHCIYLDDDELAMLKSADAVIAHCPTSNEALGSGRMPIERIRKAGIRWALASDIAAGPNLSMLHVMKVFLEVHAAAGLPISPSEALYRATLAGAQAMGMADRCGNLDIGKEANFLLLEPVAISGARNANEVISALLTNGQADFALSVRATYFRGEECYVKSD